jgi:transposase InsO family protein
MLSLVIQHHPHRPATDLWRKLVRCLARYRSTFSGVGASGKPGAVHLIRDRDARYGHLVRRRLSAMGIRDHPIAPRSPWQNGHAERLIGSIRRECLDHMVILGEDHLRRVLKAYAAYYKGLRTHLSLDKDAPTHRPIQRLGPLVVRPILGGLHHQYCRI